MNKSFKKAVASVICVLSLFGINAVAQGDEKNIVKTDVVTIDEVFRDAEFEYQVTVNDEKVELDKAKSGEYSRGMASGKAGTPSAPVFSAGKKYKNEVFSLDMIFDFDNGSGDPEDSGAWNAFQLRATDKTKVCWTTKCYSILVKKGWIEIQKFGTVNSGYILNQAFEIPEGEKVNVKYGAVDTDKGVYVFIQIANNICGVLDTENTITEEGYMNYEFRTKFQAFDTTDKEFSIALPVVSYNAEQSALTSENIFITAGTEKTAGIEENKWYISTDGFIVKVQERYNMVEEDAWEELEGETADATTVMTGDIGKYARTAVVLDNGLNVMSKEEYVSPVEYVGLNGYIGLLDCNKGWAKGKSFIYDEANVTITPFEDEYIYLPVRGVSEALGHRVDWDGELNKVYIDAGYGENLDVPKEEYNTAFIVGNRGWSKFRNLMGSAMVTASINIDGRTMLEYSDLGSALGFANVYLLKDEGVIVFSPLAFEFSSEDAKLLAEIAEYGIE